MRIEGAGSKRVRYEVGERFSKVGDEGGGGQSCYYESFGLTIAARVKCETKMNSHEGPKDRRK